MQIKRRQFRENNVQELLYLLNQVTWQAVYVERHVNAKCNTFMNIFLYYYDIAFPIKTVY